MNKKLIYIADDEINICNIIKSFLVKDGFEVEIFKDGRSLLYYLTKNKNRAVSRSELLDKV
jgi:two-component system OmpR family response regulator